MSTSYVVAQLDENLVPGQTYTFQFKCSNYFCLSNISSTLQSDITQQAPNFITSLQVTSPFGTNLYNVQFTYSGDGSDVVSDVAASIVAAAQQVSGDSITFFNATAAPAAAILSGNLQGVGTAVSGAASATGSAITGAAKTAGDALGDITGGATKGIGAGVQNLLTPVEIAVGIVVILVVILIFTAGKSGGVSAGPGGVSVGG